jgi:putative membrane protein
MKTKLALGIVAAFALASGSLPVYSAKIPAPDAKFANAAAQGNLYEAQLGKYAEAHGHDAHVRAFGKMMVADHGKALKDLEAVAQRDGIKLSDRVSIGQMLT